MTARPRARRKRTEITRRSSSVSRTAEILAAARGVLVEQGYAEFTLRNVAARAKIRLSTLQHYYPTKDDLFRAVVDQTVSDYDTAYSTQALMQSDSPRSRLLSMVDYLLADLKKPATAGFFYEFWARGFRDPYAADLMQRAYRHHRDRLRAAIAPLNPKLPGRIVEQRAVITAALIEGMILFIGAHKPEDPALEGIEKEIRNFILRLATLR